MTAQAALLFSFPDISQHMWWYMGRSSGFIAFWLLFTSVALGLAVSSRVFDGVLGRPWVFEVHKFFSIFVLMVMLFHGLIMLPDPYSKFTIRELLIPFVQNFSGSETLGMIQPPAHMQKVKRSGEP